MDGTAPASVAAYRGGMMNPARANQQDDLFTTETAGLPEVASPGMIRLRDGDRLDLRIGPVRKNIDGAELRMLAYNGSVPGPVLHVDQGSQITVQVRNDGDVEATVHWHGLRLENRYDGVPDETQAPIPVGGTYTCKVRFPDAGFYWYHPHIREDFGLEMGLYGTIVVEPADPSYWPAADRQLTLTLDDLLVEDGHIAPFRRSGPTFVAMGRYGNVMLINGETQFSGQAAAGEVVRLYLVNTANTRIFNFAIRGARAKLVGGDSGRYERETFIDEVLLAPSERAVVDVLFDTPGQVRLEHRTPDHIYDLGAFTVTDGTRRRGRRVIRGAAHRPRTHRRASVDRPRHRTAARQGARVLLADAAALRGRRHAGVRLRLPDAPRGHRRRTGDLPQVRDEAGGRAGRDTGVLRLPDAPRGHRHRTRNLPAVRDEAGCFRCPAAASCRARPGRGARRARPRRRPGVGGPDAGDQPRVRLRQHDLAAHRPADRGGERGHQLVVHRR